MRSEKEIRIRYESFKALKKGFPEKAELCFDPQIKQYEWLLEGEPRYSVAELEKIIKIVEYDAHEFDPQCMPKGTMVMRTLALLDLLKDKKKVEGILNDR